MARRIMFVQLTDWVSGPQRDRTGTRDGLDGAPLPGREHG
jgi:hypothetical protein